MPNARDVLKKMFYKNNVKHTLLHYEFPKNNFPIQFFQSYFHINMKTKKKCFYQIGTNYNTK